MINLLWLLLVLHGGCELSDNHHNAFTKQGGCRSPWFPLTAAYMFNAKLVLTLTAPAQFLFVVGQKTLLWIYLPYAWYVIPYHTAEVAFL